MKKKEYIQPAFGWMMADPEQIVALSMTNVSTSGLEQDLFIDPDDKDGDPWEEAL